MKLRHVVSCGLVLAALALTGCDEGRQRPGQTGARVVNVAPGFAQLQFRREHVNPATMNFKSVQDFSWDIDTYDFYVLERSLDFGPLGREWTFSRTLRPDVGSYMFVLAETGGEISPVVVENPPSSTTVAQVVAVHAAAELPALDLYIVAPGVGIAGAMPRGTFAALGQTPTQDLPTGDYEIWLTTAGNQAAVLFASETVTLSAGLVTIIVTPEGGASTADISVLVLQAAPVVLYDRNSEGVPALPLATAVSRGQRVPLRVPHPRVGDPGMGQHDAAPLPGPLRPEAAAGDVHEPLERALAHPVASLSRWTAVPTGRRQWVMDIARW